MSDPTKNLDLAFARAHRKGSRSRTFRSSPEDRSKADEALRTLTLYFGIGAAAIGAGAFAKAEVEKYNDLGTRAIAEGRHEAYADKPLVAGMVEYYTLREQGIDPEAVADLINAEKRLDFSPRRSQ